MASCVKNLICHHYDQAELEIARKIIVYQDELHNKRGRILKDAQRAMHDIQILLESYNQGRYVGTSHDFYFTLSATVAEVIGACSE